MRIGIDARLYQEAGVGRYIRNLVLNLQEIDHKNEYFLFLKSADCQKIEVPKNFRKIKADYSWYGYREQLLLPLSLIKYRLDLVHFPHFNVPIIYPGKFIVTIHDLIHQHFKMDRATTLSPLLYKLKRFGYNIAFSQALNRAAKIIVPSSYVKGLLIKEWSVDEKRVIETKEAVDDKFISILKKLTTQENERVLRKFKITTPYIFYVGNAHPHKNVEGLIKAYLKIREKYPELDLVLSGHDHYFWQRIKKSYPSNGIVYTGYVEDRELAVLYKNALAFVMPSLEEGFGIPILESMVCETPVVSSSAGSLPEVGGDAAVYFDPEDQDEISGKIEQVLEQPGLRRNLIRNGLKRYRQFSWKGLAEATLKEYYACGNSS